MTSASAVLLRQVHRLAGSPAPDAVLLDRFARSNDEYTFTDLVTRHGPMVWRVCRRMLGDAQAAEDAFQATFLILAQRAEYIKKPSSLAAWLHGVARRVARNVQTAENQRRRRETAVPDLDPVDPNPDPLAEVSAREALLILDDEVQRLPEQYRLPVILCCLEGMSQEEAAQRLGWSAGSVKGRLERGRKRLQERLTRRGLTLTTLLAVMTLSRHEAAAGAGRILVGGTVRAVMAFTKGEPAQIGVRVAALAEAGLKGLGVAQGKTVMALVLVAGLVIAGTGSVLLPGLADQMPKPPVVQQKPPETLPKETALLRTNLNGDPLPKGAVARLGTERFRSDAWVEQVTVVPGGKQFIGLGSHSVILWDATTGKEVRRFDAQAWRMMVSDGEAFAVSPDGKVLAVGTEESNCPILLYDLASGKKLGELPGHKGPKERSFEAHLAFVTPTLLVSAGEDRTIRVWELSSKREVGRLVSSDRRRISTLVPFPNGHHVLGCGLDDKTGGYWTVWDVATGKVLHQVDSLPNGFVRAALAPDGHSIAISLGVGEVEKEGGYNEVRLYSVSTGKEQRRWRTHSGRFPQRNSVAFAGDGKRIATGGADQKVRQWELATGTEIAPAIEPYWYANHVTYLDGSTLITFGSQNVIKLWDVSTGKPKIDLAGLESRLTALAFSPDGRHVVTGGGGGGGSLRVWEVARGKQVACLRDPQMWDVNCVHFSPDGKRILSADTGGVARLWDWSSGRQMGAFSGHKGWLHAVAFSSDGKQFATGDEAGVVRVWDLAQGKIVHTLRGHTHIVTDLVFTSDGRSLISASWDHSFRLWDLETGKEKYVVKGHTNVVTSLALSPGGLWLYSGSFDHTICVWETSSGKLCRVLKGQERDYNSSVEAIALSPDGTLLAAALGHEATSVHLWDVLTGAKMGAIPGHRDQVSKVAFSPDGRRLASGSWDTTALLWDVASLCPRRPKGDNKTVTTLWEELNSGDPEKAYIAVCRGAQAGDAAVAVLKTRMKPVAAVDPGKMTKWVRQLDSEEFADRERASQELTDLGPGIEPILRKVLAGSSTAEVKNRVEALLGLFAVEKRRTTRAVEILEMIGSREAKQLLAELAQGDCRRLTDSERNRHTQTVGGRKSSGP